MKLKFILIFFLLSQCLYSESDFSIALRGGKTIALYSGISKWEYGKDISDPSLSIGYVSKPIIIWFDFPVDSKPNKCTDSIGVSHLFFINPYSAFTLSALYWNDRTKPNVDWRGPT